MKLADILQDSDYQLTQFSKKHIERLETAIFLKERRGKQAPYVECLVRKRDKLIAKKKSLKDKVVITCQKWYNSYFNLKRSYIYCENLN